METIEIFGFVFSIVILLILPVSFLSKEKSLYFELKNFRLPVLFNAIAAILAVLVVVIYFFRSSYELYHAWNGISVQALLLWLVVLSAIYFTVLMVSSNWIKDEDSKQLDLEIRRMKLHAKEGEDDPTLIQLKDTMDKIQLTVFSHLCVYVAIFVLTAMIFTKSKIYLVNDVITGQLIDKETKSNIRGAVVKIKFQANDNTMTARTNFEGDFALIVKRGFKIDSIHISSPGYGSVVMNVSSETSLYYLLKKISLKRIQ